MALPKLILFILLGGITLTFCVAWILSLLKKKGKESLQPTPYLALTGFVTDFFDTLGIGSFATTTALFKFRKPSAVEDDRIPGTLNVGHTLPTIAQAFIYITTIDIDLLTLWLLIAASVAGAWFGSAAVTKLPVRKVQLGMGIALLIAVGLMLSSMLKLTPVGGNAMELRGIKLIVGLVGNFAFGALMTIGVGAYAPIMIMVSLLGMNPKAAFPLMMGSCAFLMPVASYRFVKSGRYDPRAALALTIFGIPAVFIAAFIVKELPLDWARWLVVVVVIYAAIVMLYSALKPKAEHAST